MKIAITGSGGLIGSSLVPYLHSKGHDVVPIVRGSATGDQVSWDPEKGTIDVDKLQGIDGVVHLAGAGVGNRRWSQRYKEVILSSRVDGTTTLVEALANLPVPPSVMVSASAVGYYGSRGDEVLTEDSGNGAGFLADVCAQWESATAPAAARDIRVVTMRTGVVLSGGGGALKKQLPPFQLGLGARLGRGSQQLSWITCRDVVAAISLLLRDSTMSGPYNVTAPNPVSNARFTKELGRALHRPARLVIPEKVIRLALGDDMAAEFLLASQRAVPQRLLAAGFSFADPTLPEALVTALGDR